MTHPRLAPVVALAAALGVAAACSGDRARGTPTRPAKGVPAARGLVGRFAYGADDGHIWTVAADGRDGRQVTRAAGGVDFDPHWSPDGARLVFRSTRFHPPDPTRTGYDGIYVVNADGGGEHAVHPPGGGLFPNWSPDGTTIVFSSPRANGTEGLFAVRADGGDLRDLAAYAEHVEWSPDGSMLLLDREDDGPGQNWEVWRSRADLTDLTRLTDAPGDDHLGAWSPDGRRVAFSSTRAGSLDVWVMDADGSRPRRIVGWDGAQAPQAWFPDGRILFVDNPPGQRPRWYVVHEDGSGLAAVPALDGVEAPVDWAGAAP